MSLEALVFTGVILLCLVVLLIPIWPFNRRHNQVWTVHGYYGAGRIVLGRMTRKHALQMTAEKFGTVMFVDDANGFIFYKPKEIKS